ncbi:hypothetical protein SCUCBS95973_004122 [Sporothrix curviconia]|uniref:Transcription factor domain-containing protein n=1 Tax=Sporothrix curviconia TaxID=1260050 RepID=A0ABP0BL15_9PEZI
MPAHHKTSILTASEVLAWGCCSQLCYPHRRCRCYQSRRYSELASINCDAAWVGRQAMSMSIALGVDTDVLPPTVVARQVVQFHMDHLRWHHSAFHGPTFLAQCEQFWSTGTADHPLWLALYFAVCSVSLWTLLNNAPARAAVLGPLVTFSLDEALVKRQYQAMVNTLYGENFLEHLSLYSVQAVVISSRIAHNLDRTDLNASLIAAAVRIGHGLGLHKISEPVVSAHNAQDNVGWHERIEIETGKRVWLQLVVQDRSQIPFTATYNIHPAQYMTPLPQNCNDDDMIERDSDMPTDSSYVRMLGRSAALIPPLLDGLGDGNGTCTYNNSIKWLPIARRTLAISAAETVIMIHRPVLLDAFRSGGKAFSQTRTTCIAAAATILREHEQTMAEQTLSMWAHSAVCVTGAVVLGLELLYRTEVTGDTTLTYRQMMARAADRLRTRHCDAVAKRGAALIETLLAAEKDLALRMTQTTARTAMTSSTTTNGDSGQATAEDHQQAIINEMIGSHEVMARFLATAPLKVDNAVPDDATTPGTLAVAAVADNRPSSPMHIPTLSGAERRADGAEAANNSSMHDLLESIDPDAGQNFDSWFNNVFAPVYDPLP